MNRNFSKRTILLCALFAALSVSCNKSSTSSGGGSTPTPSPTPSPSPSPSPTPTPSLEFKVNNVLHKGQFVGGNKNTSAKAITLNYYFMIDTVRYNVTLGTQKYAGVGKYSDSTFSSFQFARQFNTDTVWNTLWHGEVIYDVTKDDNTYIQGTFAGKVGLHLSSSIDVFDSATITDGKFVGKW
ncbi:MAG: hypothetical protein H6551_12555 [Chitinophagales bacterium]|nr:hypothetical protein [Chitinophagaceae bacterium]MCB9065962.1 hypothetical protein [Chitinophagales bacterium]